VEAGNQWGAEYFETQGLDPVESLAAAISADSDEFRVAGSLEALARSRIDAVAHDRISSDRIIEATRPLVHLLDSGWPPPDSKFTKPPDWPRFREDIELAIDFAVNGVEIPTDPQFQPRSKHGRCPRRHRDALTAINAHVYSNRALGFTVLLAPELLHGLNFNLQNYGFAEKYGKAMGRLTGNCSAVAMHGFSYKRARSKRRKASTILPLNTNWVRDDAIARWGAIDHPSLRDIARMIVRAAELYGWDVIVVYKEDVRGFYQLVWFHPSFVRLMCFQLFLRPNDDAPAAYAVSLAGNFGWSAMPMVMEVITRLLRVIIGFLIFGFMLMYVDDIIGVAPRSQWQADRQKAIDSLQLLLGPRAHAEDKGDSTERTSERVVDVIGWTVDLMRRQVTVSRKNQIKALHCFTSVDLSRRLDFETKERLCSLAERYSHIYSECRLLMPSMYSMLGGRHRVDPGVLLPTPPRAIWAIRIWQIYLKAAEAAFLDGDQLGRPLDWYAEHTAFGTVEFDGCPDGIGWRLLQGSSCVASGFYSTPPEHLPSRDSSFQNTMELTALTLGLIHAASLGWQRCGIQLRGDSDTVLHWSLQERFRSDHALGSAALFMAVCRRFQFHIHSTSHWISSADNAICDHLSRSRPTEAQSIGDCGSTGPIDFSTSALFVRAMRLCRPIPLDTLSESDFINTWAAADSLCSGITICSL
jgi:ribonuclease HI